MRNRLIGLAIVLVVLFLLSWLIPRHQSAQDEHSVAVSAVPVGATSVPVGPASVAVASNGVQPAPATAVGSATAGGVTSTGEDGIHTQPYQAAGPAAPTAGEGNNTQISAAQSASQYASAAAAPTRAKADEQAHSKSRAETAAAVPQPHPEPRTKTAAAAAYPASPGDAYVQIGSYGEMANAQKMLSSLKQKGFRGRIDTAAVRGKTYYRVRVGPYVDKKAAGEAQRQLTAKGYKGTRVVDGS